MQFVDKNDCIQLREHLQTVGGHSCINNSTKYIDVDTAVMAPSPARVRNILTMEERVQAILAYDCRPMYTKVAKMFNCSWEQIKNIIQNRDAIMEFYEATKKTAKKVDPNLDEIRQRKISFLGECMYEYIQRAQFHLRTDLTEELIRMKALEFRDVMQIQNFMPNKAWINHFKATYNFSLSNRQITLTRTPPASLDLKAIMMYCSRNKASLPTQNNVTTVIPPGTSKNLYRAKTQMDVLNANTKTLEELKQRNARKINFLERALHEYIVRSQYHYKPVLLANLHMVINDLIEILKIDNYPTGMQWFCSFQRRYNVSLKDDAVTSVMPTVTPPLSLDLRDILSFCSRNEKNQNVVKLSPKETGQITIRKIASTTIQPIPKRTATETQQIEKNSSQRSEKITNYPVVPFVEIKTEAIDLDENEEDKEEEEDVDKKPDLPVLQKITNEYNDSNESGSEAPTSKRPKLETEAEKSVASPGHWSEQGDKNDDEELPKNVQSYEDALKLLKPLEEFAMLEENYRAIGLISQLENIFKKPPKKN